MTIEYKETTKFDKNGKISVAEPGHVANLPRGKGWGDMGDRRTLLVIDKDSVKIAFFEKNKLLFDYVYRGEEINEVHRNTNLVIEPMTRRDRFLNKVISYSWRPDKS